MIKFIKSNPVAAADRYFLGQYFRGEITIEELAKHLGRNNGTTVTIEEAYSAVRSLGWWRGDEPNEIFDNRAEADS